MASWLNSLSDVECDRLRETASQFNPTRPCIFNVGGLGITVLAGDALNADSLSSLSARPGMKNGRWWYDWVECEVVEGRVAPGGYPRWQVDLTSTRPGSSGRAFRDSISPEGYLSLRDGESRRQEKFALHHISARCQGLVLPEAGGHDVSHLCDRRKCWRGEHLVVESHADNMARQRCTGVILFVWEGQIFSQHVQCKHSSHQGSSNPDFEGVCRKVTILLMDDGAVSSLATAFCVVRDEFFRQADKSSGASYRP